MPNARRAWEKMYRATRVLATGRSDIRDRLRSAFQTFMPLFAEELPEDLRDDFSSLVAQMSRIEAVGGEGMVTATLRIIDEDEAVEIAGKIVDLYNAIATRYYNR